MALKGTFSTIAIKLVMQAMLIASVFHILCLGAIVTLIWKKGIKDKAFSKENKTKYWALVQAAALVLKIKVLMQSLIM